MNNFSVCLLNPNGDPSKLFIFSGKNKPPVSELFSSIDLLKFKEFGVEFNYVDEFIYNDDNIKTIKRKILDALNYQISYNEIYLFGKSENKYSIEEIFNNINKYNNNTDLITNQQLQKLIDNIENFNYNIKNKDEGFSFNDLYDLNIPSVIEHFVPIGSMFTDFFDFMFSSNPFSINKSNFIDNFNSNINTLATLDNSLLFEYNIKDNIIYLCNTLDVLTYFDNKSVTDSYIIDIYYPFLSNENILNADALISNKDKLIKKDKTKIKSNSKKYFEKINLFHEISTNNSSPLEYIDYGINNVNMTFYNFKSFKLPLESIFKIVHASNNMPFIKFNPGKKKDNIFRIYSESNSKNGKKIPFLNRVKIINLSKIIAKSERQISFYNIVNNDFKTYELIIDLLENGDFNIKIDSNEQFDISNLNNIISNSINSIIKNINNFLDKFGIYLDNFESTTNYNVKINNIDYFKSIPLKKKINYSKYTNLFNSIFDVINDNNKTIELNYKRVSNFKKMNGINKFIHSILNSNINTNEIIDKLIENYDITIDKAEEYIVDYRNNFNQINGKFVNKVDDIIENPGFTTLIQSIPFDEKITVFIKGIDNIKYISHIDVYIDSLFRLLQFPDTINIPDSKINSISKKQIDTDLIDDDKPMIITTNDAKPIAFKQQLEISDIINNQYVENNEDKLSDDDDDSDGLLFDDDDIDENIANFNSDDMDNDSDNEILGGSKTKDLDVTGMPLTKPNMFFEKLLSNDPKLFLTRKSGKYEAYSRLCQHNTGKQPVILTQEEKDNIDENYPNSYTNSIEYGSDPNKKFHYICPRFWCLKTNSSISEKDVKEGKCGKIIPKGADKVGEGEGVIEFHKKRTVIDENGEEKESFNVPGFLKPDAHPDGLCIPCCFKDWNSKQQVNRREQCLKGDKTKLNKTDKPEYDSSYIISYETFPLPKNRFGFMPPAMELFLQEDYSKKINPENNHLLIKDKVTLVRYGIEQDLNQSFIGVLAEIHKDILKKNYLPSIKEMKKLIVDNLSLDSFTRLQNGTLISLFKSKNNDIDNSVINNYADSYLFKQIDPKNEDQKIFFKDVLSSYLNFIKFINDDKAIIDHTYLWDLVVSKDTGLFDTGINLVIFEVLNNDITNNIELLCPSYNYSSLKFDKKKPVVILIKNNHYYEIISALTVSSKKDKNSNTNIKNIFYNNQLPEYNDIIFNVIYKILNHKCKPIKNSNTHNFVQNIDANRIYDILINKQYEIKYQVLNYQGKCVAFLVNKNFDHDVYIPCYPSKMFKNIEVKFFDEDNIYNDYKFTTTALNEISNDTNFKVLCKPKNKVIDDGLIVGIITETNQFIQINPHSQDIFKDNISPIYDSNYVSVDKNIFKNNNLDDERVQITNKIKLENLFYSAFRNTVRILLNNKLNKDDKLKLKERIKDRTIIYADKLRNVEQFLRYFVSNFVSFDQYDENALNELTNISTCFSNPSNKSFCLFKNDDYKLILPKKHLFTNKDNENIYYFRLADELIRYKHIQEYMLNSKSIINISNVDYNINNNEFILIQSLLNNEYFDDIDPIVKNDYVSNNTYDISNPIDVNNDNLYDNIVDLNDQNEFKNNNKYDFVTKLISFDCIQKIKEIKEINDEDLDSWDNTFIGSREIFIKPIPICTFNVLRLLMYFSLGIKLSINNVKKYIFNTYENHFKKYGSKIKAILKSQGKQTFIDAIEKNKENLENIIYSENYYLTDLDILACIEGVKNKSDKYVLKFVLFSEDNFKTMNSNINWIAIQNKENDFFNDNHYFIRVPDRILIDKPMAYSIIEAPMKFINNEFVDTNKSYFNKNIFTFESFLKKYNLK